MNFGAAIQKFRKQKKLSQSLLAQKLNITSTYLSALENNRKEPSLSLLNDICNVLELPKELLFWELIEVSSSVNSKDKKIMEMAKDILKKYYESI